MREDLHRSELVPAGMPPARNAMNQGLSAAIHRVFRPPGDSGAADVHVTELTPQATSWIARFVALGLLLVAVATVRRARDGPGEWLAATSLFALCMLLAPIAWKAHHVALLPFFYVLVCHAAVRGRPRWLIPVLVAYWIGCDLLSEEVVGKGGKHLLQSLSLITWATVGLMGVAALLVGRASTRAAPRGIL